MPFLSAPADGTRGHRDAFQISGDIQWSYEQEPLMYKGMNYTVRMSYLNTQLFQTATN